MPHFKNTLYVKCLCVFILIVVSVMSYSISHVVISRFVLNDHLCHELLGHNSYLSLVVNIVFPSCHWFVIIIIYHLSCVSDVMYMPISRSFITIFICSVFFVSFFLKFCFPFVFSYLVCVLCESWLWLWCMLHTLCWWCTGFWIIYCTHLELAFITTLNEAML